MRTTIAIAVAFLALPAPPAASADEGRTSHALALFGDVKYPPDFTHFDYVEPDPPKGGTARFAVAQTTFDTLNPYIVKGNPAAGLDATVDTLMVRSLDEPDTEYGLIAESVTVAPDRTWVTYNLRREARFQDGSPITPEDVIWTFTALRDKGRPNFRAYYADVATAEKTGERGVKFTFKTAENRELPYIVGQLPVLPRSYWDKHDFEKTTLEPPLGSGPYKIEAIDPGRSITYRRVADYWAAKLPAVRGHYNFDIMRYDYYRDPTIALEAFKAGQFDLRLENSAKNWAIGYDGPALQKGLIKKEDIPNKLPTGMQGFGFNTRRPVFADRRVRQALGYAFDYEWSNKTLFYNAYTRTESYFSNSDLASRGPPSPEELAILEPYKGQIPAEVLTTPYAAPKTDGSGNIRDNLRQALRLLKEAGWTVKSEKLVDDKTGQPLEFEILLSDPQFERIALPFAQNLQRLGVTARVRTVDSAQYQRRMDEFDYDMTIVLFPQSLSPGNEQRDFWSAKAAKEVGSNNLLGVSDPVVDQLVDLIIAADTRERLISRTRALDRVLLHSHYVVPNWHLQSFRVAYWDKFLHSRISPPYGLELNSWWIDPAKEQTVESRKQEVKP